jgi:hypothetical protein
MPCLVPERNVNRAPIGASMIVDKSHRHRCRLSRSPRLSAAVTHLGVAAPVARFMPLAGATLRLEQTIL